MLHTENVARGGGGQTESFQNVGGQRCIECINFSKVLGGKSSPRGGKCPHLHPLNETLVTEFEKRTLMLGKMNLRYGHIYSNE